MSHLKTATDMALSKVQPGYKVTKRGCELAPLWSHTVKVMPKSPRVGFMNAGAPTLLQGFIWRMVVLAVFRLFVMTGRSQFHTPTCVVASAAERLRSGPGCLSGQSVSQLVKTLV